MHEDFKEAELPHRKLKRLVLSPNANGIAVQKKFANDDLARQVAWRGCYEIIHLTFARLTRFGEAIVEGITGPAHGADGILLTTRIEQFAQAADMHVDRALINVDVAAPDAVEQLLA